MSLSRTTKDRPSRLPTAVDAFKIACGLALWHALRHRSATESQSPGTATADRSAHIGDNALTLDA
jgi:hypothetical protein